MWEVRLRSMLRVDRPLHSIKGQLCYLFEGFSRVLLSDPRDPKGYLSVSTEDGFLAKCSCVGWFGSDQ